MGRRGSREPGGVAGGKHNGRRQALGSEGTNSLYSAGMVVKPFICTEILQSLI